MCGIAGIVGRNKDCRVEHSDVRRMCDVIVHRGPDDEGLYVDGHVGLGMRRLSIIDLSSGHQPIHNEEETVWIVFNGEIYNFLELRSDLESRGHRFYTNTDTEVIVHLYEDFGDTCVQKLRGMFAFAIWDDRQQSLLLARDRFGKKPLHYAWSGDRLFFGSEIKSILSVAPELNTVDSEGLLSYFSFGYIPDPLTAFTQIKKLPPGHVLKFCNGQTRVRQYWDLPHFGSYEPPSEDGCLADLEHRLGEAVKIRLISDVPLGALLSGGVDSSVVVALMAKYSTAPVKTFTIRFPNADFNEAGYARSVANTFKTEHHEFVVEPNFLELLGKLTQILEEPFGDSSIIPTFCVSRLAREHVTVALAGDGGDELFAGYDRYQINLQRRKRDFIPGWCGRIYRERIFRHLPEGTYGRRFLYTMSLPEEQRYLDEISMFSLNGKEQSIFSSDFKAIAEKYPSPMDRFRDYLDVAPTDDALAQLQYLDIKTYLPGDILTKVDRMSMATSLEVRAPLLDHVFAEWVTQLPSSWKLRGREKKYLLKKLALRLGVPRDAIYRPKQGFAVPLVHWFRKELKQDLLGILLEPQTLQRGYFSTTGIRQLIDEFVRGRRDRSNELWTLLIFELWHRNFLQTTPRAALDGSYSAMTNATA
jgi:asparagine synthase (glutamine-hydrolysing)